MMNDEHSNTVRQYFAYGINMDRDQVRSLCPDAVPVGPATLEGYRFLVNRLGWATIIPGDRSRVHGVLWRMPADCLDRLDEFEGVDEGLYRRTEIQVSSTVGDVAADVYLAFDSEPGMPDPGYMESIVRAAERAKAPPGYLRELERWRK